MDVTVEMMAEALQKNKFYLNDAKSRPKNSTAIFLLLF